AIADYSEALKLDPRNLFGWSSRAIVYLRKGDRGRAVSDYEQANRLDPARTREMAAASSELREISLAAPGEQAAPRPDVGEGRVSPVALPASTPSLVIHKDLTLPMAIRMARTAMLTCRKSNYAVSAHVVGRNGDVIVAMRGDNAGPHTVEN